MSSAPRVARAGDFGYTCNKAALSASQELQQDPCIFPSFFGCKIWSFYPLVNKMQGIGLNKFFMECYCIYVIWII